MKFLNEFIFDSFDEAMKVHKKIFEICREKHYVTCADLYFLLHTEDEYKLCPSTFYNHGWTNLWTSKVEPSEDMANGNWILKLPQVKYIKIKKEND